MTVEELLQKVVDQQAALESVLRALSASQGKVPAGSIHHRVQDAARMIRMILPEEYNFFFMACPIGSGPGRRACYSSDMDAKAIRESLQEFLDKSGPNPWKHSL